MSGLWPCSTRKMWTVAKKGEKIKNKTQTPHLWHRTGPPQRLAFPSSLISSSTMQSQLPQEPKDVFLGATAPKIAASPQEAENSYRGATCGLCCGGTSRKHDPHPSQAQRESQTCSLLKQGPGDLPKCMRKCKKIKMQKNKNAKNKNVKMSLTYRSRSHPT